MISQIGKRGTNDWHFGAQVVWEPKRLAASHKSTYYPNAALPTQAGTGTPYNYENSDLPGTIYRDRNDDRQWSSTYSGYVSGPLVQDRLFIFLSAEQEKTEGVSTNSVAANPVAQNHYAYSNPKVYAKVDWNINDSNTLEYTYIKNNDRKSGAYFGFDYDTLSGGDSLGSYPNTTKVDSRYDVLKYTGYLTDDLTLSATYGRSKRNNLSYNTGNLDSLAVHHRLPQSGSVHHRRQPHHELQRVRCHRRRYRQDTRPAR